MSFGAFIFLLGLLVFGLWFLKRAIAPRSTAEIVAAARAMDHFQISELPAAARRFPTDEWAQYMIRPGLRWLLQYAAVRWLLKWMTRKQGQGASSSEITSTVTGRTRFIDSRIQRALDADADIHQLVILGAGYDCRAYRMAPMFVQHNVKAFEVDLPHLQQIKKEKVLQAIQELQLQRQAQGQGQGPSVESSLGHVQYVSTDFNMNQLPTVLQQDHGFNKEIKTIFLFEGVAGYLEEEAVYATFRFIHEYSPPGSILIATFPVLPTALVTLLRSDPKKAQELFKDPQEIAKIPGITPDLARHLAMIAKLGEPRKSSFSAEELPGFFTSQKFDILEMGTPESMSNELLAPDEGRMNSRLHIAVLRNT